MSPEDGVEIKPYKRALLQEGVTEPVSLTRSTQQSVENLLTGTGRYACRVAFENGAIEIDVYALSIRIVWGR